MPNSQHNNFTNSFNNHSISNSSIKVLEQEFAEINCLSDYEESSGNTFKALNFASFESSSNTAVYRSVKLGLDPSVKTFSDFGHPAGNANLVRSGTDSHVFADTSFCHSQFGSDLFLSRANSCSFQKQCNGKTQDIFGAQPVNTPAKTKENFNVKVQSLLWKFKEYTVSKCHGFTSMEISELQQRIENACHENDIDFSFKTDGEFGYDCQCIRDCLVSEFSLVVSCLQSSCQKIIGERYVVEVVKLDCDSPMTWERIVRGLMSCLKDCVQFRKVEKEQKCMFSELFSESRSQVQNRADQLKHTLAPTENLNLLTSFIDFMSGTDNAETQVKFAEVYASLSTSYKSGEEKFDLREGDIEKILAILASGNFELNRCVCILIKNTASLWFGNVCEGSKESLFKSLVRVVNIVGDSSAQLSTLSALKFQKEAISALVSLRPFFNPMGFTKEMAKIMFSRCTISKDDSLAKCAAEALRVYDLA